MLFDILGGFTMTTQEAFAIGEDRGYALSAVLDMNTQDIVTFFDEAYAAELNARQYSDFSFIAHALNTSLHPDDAWEQFEMGVETGIYRAWLVYIYPLCLAKPA